MEIKVQVKGVDDLVRNLRDLGINRIPNYVARSLTLLAERVQDAMIGETKEHLTVRGTWLKKGARYGINRKAATKTDLTATVWTQAPWLIEQEEAKPKTPRSGVYLAIPLLAIRSGRTDPKKIPRRLSPSALRGKVVEITEKGQTILYEHGTKVSRHFLPLYLLKRSAPIPKRIHLLETADKTINAMYRGVMSEMIGRAIAEKG